MKQTRLILAGGFLGAGKTTLIWEAAKRLIAQGKRVGIVTNDQAPELVDSQLLKLSSLDVAEVAGSCFCCNFNGFVDAIHSLQNKVDADVILAEPVGSCADLSATILNPLKQFHNTEVLVSPLTVLTEPSRLRSIVYGGNGGLHEDAAYIYRKQMEESDIILITKTDTLSDNMVEKLKKDTSLAFPSAKVMCASSLEGKGVNEWLDEVGSRIDAGTKLLDIDYDKYAHGEAVLGWLNATLALQGSNVNWNAFLKEVMEGLNSAFKAEQLGIGHVKVIVECGKDYSVGNITGSEYALTFRGDAGKGDNARIIINARVETSPGNLHSIVKQTLVDVMSKEHCSDEILALRFLQPGRPNPTHRFSEIVK